MQEILHHLTEAHQKELLKPRYPKCCKIGTVKGASLRFRD